MVNPRSRSPNSIHSRRRRGRRRRVTANTPPDRSSSDSSDFEVDTFRGFMARSSDSDTSSSSLFADPPPRRRRRTNVVDQYSRRIDRILELESPFCAPGVNYRRHRPLQSLNTRNLSNRENRSHRHRTSDRAEGPSDQSSPVEGSSRRRLPRRTTRNSTRQNGRRSALESTSSDTSDTDYSPRRKVMAISSSSSTDSDVEPTRKRTRRTRRLSSDSGDSSDSFFGCDWGGILSITTRRTAGSRRRRRNRAERRRSSRIRTADEGTSTSSGFGDIGRQMLREMFGPFFNGTSDPSSASSSGSVLTSTDSVTLLYGPLLLQHANIEGSSSSRGNLQSRRPFKVVEVDHSSTESDKEKTPLIKKPNKSKVLAVDHDFSSSDDESEKCPICLIKFVAQLIGTPSICDHNFCAACLEKWAQSCTTCPVDRLHFSYIAVRKRIGGKVIKKIFVGYREFEPDYFDNPEDIFEVYFCEVCNQSQPEANLLLCDRCDRGFHTYCLNPPLLNVPSGNWYCPECASTSENETDEDDAVVVASGTRDSNSSSVYRNNAGSSNSVSSRNRTTHSGGRSGRQQRPRNRRRQRQQRSTSDSLVYPPHIAFSNDAAVRYINRQPTFSLFENDYDALEPFDDDIDMLYGIGNDGGLSYLLVQRYGFPSRREQYYKAATASRLAPADLALETNVLDSILESQSRWHAKNTEIIRKEDGTLEVRTSNDGSNPESEEKSDILNKNNLDHEEEKPGILNKNNLDTEEKVDISNSDISPREVPLFPGTNNAPKGTNLVGETQNREPSSSASVGVPETSSVNPTIRRGFSNVLENTSAVDFSPFRTTAPIRFRMNPPTKPSTRRPGIPSASGSTVAPLQRPPTPPLLLESLASPGTGSSSAEDDVDLYGDIESTPVSQTTPVSDKSFCSSLEPPPIPPVLLMKSDESGSDDECSGNLVIDLNPQLRPPADGCKIYDPTEPNEDSEDDDDDLPPPPTPPEPIVSSTPVEPDYMHSPSYGEISNYGPHLPLPEPPALHAELLANISDDDQDSDCPNIASYNFAKKIDYVLDIPVPEEPTLERIPMPKEGMPLLKQAFDESPSEKEISEFLEESFKQFKEMKSHGDDDQMGSEKEINGDEKFNEIDQTRSPSVASLEEFRDMEDQSKGSGDEDEGEEINENLCRDESNLENEDKLKLEGAELISEYDDKTNASMDSDASDSSRSSYIDRYVHGRRKHDSHIQQTIKRIRNYREEDIDFVDTSTNNEDGSQEKENAEADDKSVSSTELERSDLVDFSGMSEEMEIMQEHPTSPEVETVLKEQSPNEDLDQLLNEDLDQLPNEDFDPISEAEGNIQEEDGSVAKNKEGEKKKKKKKKIGAKKREGPTGSNEKRRKRDKKEKRKNKEKKVDRRGKENNSKSNDLERTHVVSQKKEQQSIEKPGLPKKKKEKREELPRYDIRQVLMEKPRHRTDKFGRHISPSRSRSLSPLIRRVSLNRSRSPRSRERRSREGRWREPSPVWKKRDPRSQTRRSGSRSRVRNVQQINRYWKNQSAEVRSDRKQERGRLMSNSKRKRSKSLEIIDAYREMPKEMRKKKQTKGIRTNRSRSRSFSPFPADIRRPHFPDQTMRMSPDRLAPERISRVPPERASYLFGNWEAYPAVRESPELLRYPTQYVERASTAVMIQRVPTVRSSPVRPPAPGEFTVVVPNKGAMSRKQKRAKKDKNTKRKRKKRSPSPAVRPAKEVIASGDNIVVSVNFDANNESSDFSERRVSGCLAEKRTIPAEPVVTFLSRRKRKRVSSNIPQEVLNSKPVAVIDLNMSPFKEIASSPVDVISLTDSGDEATNSPNQSAANHTPECAGSRASEHSPEHQEFVGPKTPPEPPLKFTLSSTSHANMKPVNPAFANDDDEVEDQGDLQNAIHTMESADVSFEQKSRSASPKNEVCGAENDQECSVEPEKNEGKDSDLESVRSTTSTPVQDNYSASPDGVADASPGSATPPSAEIVDITRDTKSPSRVCESVKSTPSKPAMSESTLRASVTRQPLYPEILPWKLPKSSQSSVSPASVAVYTPAMTISSAKSSSKLAQVLEPLRNQNGSQDDVVELDNSPYSPASSEGDDIFEPPPSSPASKSKHLPLPAVSSKNNSKGKQPNAASTGSKPKTKAKKEIGIKADEDQLKILDEVPNSAVEMIVKEKFLKKLHRQERVVEEVKIVLKPHYIKKHITKEDYKEILRKAVPKICHNKSGDINPSKIHSLVEQYVKNIRRQRKKQQTKALPTLIPAKKTKLPWS